METSTMAKNQQIDKYVQKSGKTEMARLIERHIEIPAAMRLNGGGRKKLAEIAPEYHPECRRMEQTIIDTDHKEKNLKYKYLNFRRTFATPIGKRNQVAKNREIQLGTR